MKQHFEVFLSKSNPALTNIYEEAKCHHAGVVPRHDVMFGLATTTLTNCRLSRFLTVGILSNNIGVSLTKTKQSIT